MTVALDAVSNGVASTNNISWTHTPVGTPRGVSVKLESNTAGTPSATYGGVAMTAVGHVISSSTSTNMRDVYSFFLGASVPTGAQTVTVTQSSSASADAQAVTVTAAADTEINTFNSIDSVNTSGAITATLSLGGVESLVLQGFGSSESLESGVTPLSGDWTSQYERDAGSFVQGLYTYNPVGTADVTFGANHNNAESLCVFAVAISEISAGGYTATGALAAQASTLVGDAIRSLLSNGALSSADATLAASVFRTILSTGSLDADSASLSGTAIRNILAASALLPGSANVSGTATVGSNPITATGVLLAGLAAVDGDVYRTVLATGGLSAQSSSITGGNLVAVLHATARFMAMRGIRIS